MKKDGTNDHLSAHYLGGRSFGPIVSAGTVFASFFSGYTVVGVVNGTACDGRNGTGGFFFIAGPLCLMTNLTIFPSLSLSLSPLASWCVTGRQRHTILDGWALDGCQQVQVSLRSMFWYVLQQPCKKTIDRCSENGWHVLFKSLLRILVFVFWVFSYSKLTPSPWNYCWFRFPPYCRPDWGYVRHRSCGIIKVQSISSQTDTNARPCGTQLLDCRFWPQSFTSLHRCRPSKPPSMEYLVSTPTHLSL